MERKTFGMISPEGQSSRCGAEINKVQE